MRFTFVLIALVASTSAFVLESRQSIPNCAVSCIANADLGGCGAADNKCLCNNSAFVSSTSTCIAKSCTGSDLTNAQQAAQAICLSVGVTLSPTSTSASGSAASATATTTSPAKASSTGTSTGTTTSAAAAATKSSSAISNGVNALAGVAAVALVGFTIL